MFTSRPPAYSTKGKCDEYSSKKKIIPIVFCTAELDRPLQGVDTNVVESTGCLSFI